MQERNSVAGFEVGEGHMERAWERPLGAESKSPDDNQQKKKKGDLGPTAEKTGVCEQLENLGSRFFPESPDKTPVWLIS